MAILWDKSLIPWTDRNGDPYAGAKAYFFDAQTTTPQIVYKEADLSIPHDHPVVANADGEFPPIFLIEQTTHRVRITTADDVTIWDVDGVSVPTTIPPDPPSGDTPEELLFRTGDIKMAWRTGSPPGFVRCNGRSIGAPSSGATERANADCEALFKHLWNNDLNLPVSGGRGATADGDWSAAKRIDLPDMRGVALVGLLGMGNTPSTVIPADQITSGDGNTLGDKAGAATVQLTAAQMPKHGHSGSTGSAGAHTHLVVTDGETSGGLTSSNSLARQGNRSGDYSYGAAGLSGAPSLGRTSSDGAHTHTVTVGEAGGDAAHPNVQPSLFVPFFIKL